MCAHYKAGSVLESLRRGGHSTEQQWVEGWATRIERHREASSGSDLEAILRILNLILTQYYTHTKYC